MPPQPIQKTFQTPPLPEGEKVEDMMTPCKRRARANLPRPHLTAIPDEIGEYIARGVLLAKDLGWEDFFKKKRGWGEFSNLGRVDHPAFRLLRQYQYRGDPVGSSGQW